MYWIDGSEYTGSPIVTSGTNCGLASISGGAVQLMASPCNAVFWYLCEDISPPGKWAHLSTESAHPRPYYGEKPALSAQSPATFIQWSLQLGHIMDRVTFEYSSSRRIPRICDSARLWVKMYVPIRMLSTGLSRH